MKKVNTVRVKMWGTTVGYLHQEDNGLVGFQYDDEFLKSNIEISPVTMPLSNVTYSFRSLPEQTFYGLPGMVADSLPDRFGNIVINRYLESQGREPDSLSVIERLCYTGKRGMGALEYDPAYISDEDDVFDVNVNELYAFAKSVLSERAELTFEANRELLWADLVKLGTSPGGKRPKALIAINEADGSVKSGQAVLPEEQGCLCQPFREQLPV